jgi:hypothetical protein
MYKLFNSIIIAVFSLLGLLWFFIPWGPFVGLYLGLYVWLWVLVYLTFVGLSARRLLFSFIIASPLVLSSVFPPSLLGIPFILPAAFLYMWYVASRRLGWRWGFLYVVSVHLLAATAMFYTDIVTGVAKRANAVGLDPYERVDVALFLTLSSLYFVLANLFVSWLFAKLERDRRPLART